MAEAKDQTAATPRTRTAKKTTTSNVTKPAAKTAAPKTTAAKTTAAKAEAKPATETAGAAAQTAAQTATETATATATETATATPSAAEPAAPQSQTTKSQTSKAEAEKPVQSTPNADETTHRVSVTIPLDGAVVGVAVKAASLPLTAAKKVAQNKNGIPAYIAVGSLAVIGAVEWPVAAVGGLGLAALRRWGPLKPAQNQESAKSA